MAYENIGTPTGNNLYITIPLRGTDNWDEKLKDGFFQRVVDHDHTPGKGAAIQEAALDSALQTKVAAIATNTNDISSLGLRMTTAESDITSLQSSAGSNLKVLVAGSGFVVSPGNSAEVDLYNYTSNNYDPSNLESSGDVTIPFNGNYLLSVNADSGTFPGTLSLRVYVTPSGGTPSINTLIWRVDEANAIISDLFISASQNDFISVTVATTNTNILVNTSFTLKQIL